MKPLMNGIGYEWHKIIIVISCLVFMCIRLTKYIFFDKKGFFSFRVKNETSLHRKSVTEICRELQQIFFIGKRLLSVKKL